ncbi:MAG: HAD family phosphatase [Deltaproteobacteria bacterium]|nr:HAD family phosphatase [Deltaproteobacteria bacterium]
MSIAAIIFDCDGVLVDSEKISCSAWLPVLHNHGLNIALAEIEKFIGKSDQAVIEYIQYKYKLKLAPDIIAERQNQYFKMAANLLQPFAGVHKVISELHKQNIKLAVASSGGHPKIAFSLKVAGLTNFFSTICSATEVANGKPAPDLFILAAQRLGILPQQCVVIEDSIFGIQAACQANMMSLGFCSSFSAATLLNAGANGVFNNYEEFIPCLKKLNDS